MKTLSLLLAFAFFFQPFGVSVAPFAKSSTAYAQTLECPEGQVYNSQLNRCVLTEGAVQTRNEARECEGLTGDQAQDCFKRNAQAQVDDIVSDQEADGDKERRGNSALGHRSLVPLTISLASGYYLLKNRNAYSKCSSLSMKLILAASLAGLVGEVSSHIIHKSKLKKAEESYKEEVDNYNSEERENHESMTRTQELAFDYMIESEESAKSSEKIRRVGHVLATGLYTSAMIATGVEIYKSIATGEPSTCNASSNTNTSFKQRSHLNFTPLVDKNALSLQAQFNSLIDEDNFFASFAHVENITEEEIDESILRKIYYNLVPIVHAQEQPAASGGGKGMQAVMGLLTASLTIIPMLKGSGASKVLSTGGSTTTGATGTADTANTKNGFGRFMSNPYTRLAISGVLGGYSGYLIKETSDNIKIYEDRIEQIQEIKTGFTNSGGTEGFKLCEGNNCFDEANKNDLANYNTFTGDSYQTASVCINYQNQVDPECACKRRKIKGQGNSCKRLSSSYSLSTVGASYASPFVSASDRLLGGSLSASDLSTGSLVNQISSLSKAKEKLFKKSKKVEEAFKNAEKLGLKIKKRFSNNVKKSLPKNFQAPSLASANIKNSPNLKKIVDNVKKKIAKAEKAKFVTGGDAKSNKKKNDFDLNFDEGNEESAQIDDVAAVMQKEFKITGDINKNSSQDIFKILSNRYQRSALRRLFDESGKSSVDSASSSDINGI